MKVSDPSVQQDQPTPPAIAIIGMECSFPGAANLADFWHVSCFGSVKTDAAAAVSDDRLAAVIAAALANRDAAREEQRQAALRQRRQASASASAGTKRAVDHPRHLQYRLVPSSRPRPGVQQAQSANGPTRLLIAVAGDSKPLDTRRFATLAMASECTLQVHATPMQGLAAVIDALGKNECEIAVLAAQDSSAGRRMNGNGAAHGAHPGAATAALVLVRTGDAQRDDERIYASIRGVDLEAVTAQPQSAADLVQRLYQRLAIEPARINLLESVVAAQHGANRVGEMATLNALFGGAEYPTLLLGASNPAAGELGTLAGIASVIKTTLALYHRTLPPVPPGLDAASLSLGAGSRLYVRSQPSPWIVGLEAIRFAAVNQDTGDALRAHVILEEAPPQDHLVHRLLTRWSCELMVLSAPTLELLQQTMTSLHAALEANPSMLLVDLAYTLAQRYSPADRFRLATVVSGIPEFKQRLTYAAKRLTGDNAQNWADFSGVYYGCKPASGKLAFIFPGVGFPGLSGSYADRIGEVALHFPEMRWWLDFAESNCLGDGVPYPLRFQLYPPDKFDAATLAKIEEELKWSQRAAAGTQVANLATYQLARWLGLVPEAMAGFSLGEWSALVAAGLIDTHGIKEWQDSFVADSEAARAVPSHRGTWAMATASAEQVEAIIRPLGNAVGVTLDVSANQVFIGGDTKGMVDALALLNDAGIWAMPLPADGPMAAFSAFHTPHASAFAENMRASLTGLPLGVLDCTIYSSVNARAFPDDPVQIMPLIVENASKPVRLRDTLSLMYRDGFRTFVQLGGGGKLLATVEKILGLEPHVVLSIDVEYMSGLQQLQILIGRLLCMGKPMLPLKLFHNRNCRTLDLNLPALPQQRNLQPVTPGLRRPPMSAAQSRPAMRAAASKVIAPARPAREAPRSYPTPMPLAVTAQPPPAPTLPMRAATVPADSAPPAARASSPTRPWPLVGDIQQHVPGKQLDSILTLDLSIHRFLAEHQLILVPDGLKPPSEMMATLPFTFGVEIICEVAQTLVPELRVIGCRDIEQTKFVALKSSETLGVWIRARRASEFAVAVEFGMVGDSKPALRGTVEMAAEYPELPAPFEIQNEYPCPYDADWYYDEGPFFHGPLWRAQKKLLAMTPYTIRGNLIVNAPQDFFYGSEPRSTIFEAVLLDAVAQMMGFREWVERQRFFVPIAVKRYSFHHRAPRPGSYVETRIRWRELDARRIEGDFTVLDEDGNVTMHIEGWREWWMIWPKCFFQANHLSRVAQIATEWSTPARPLTACRTNQAAFLDADADFVGRLYLTASEWRQYQQQRRVDWLIGRIAAKDAVRAWYRTRRGRQLHPLEVSIESLADGALVVVLPGDEALHVSVACTDDEAVAVVSDDHIAGVDIAAIRQREPAFLEVLFDAAEMSLLPQTHLLEWVHRAWVAKEAFCKIADDGSRALDQVRIRGVREQDGVIEVAAVGDPQVREVHTTRDKSCVLAIAWRPRIEQQASLTAVPQQESSTASFMPRTAGPFKVVPLQQSGVAMPLVVGNTESTDGALAPMASLQVPPPAAGGDPEN